jgi:SAM-dependent methyltransferase
VNHLLHGVARALTETFVCPGPILEIGSYQVPGQESIGDLRALFPGQKYVGLDMRPGPGVDCVADVEKLPQTDASVGTIIALNTFEHVRHFWRGFEEIHRVLKPDGVLLVSSPFFFRIHNYPEDYWRFTPAAFEVVLEEYSNKIIGWHGPKQRPANVWAFAGREHYPRVTAEQFANYQRLLGVYAREPATSWTRSWRYRMARLLCGRGPFAPYLDRNRLESICLDKRVESFRIAAPPTSAAAAARVFPSPLYSGERGRGEGE